MALAIHKELIPLGARMPQTDRQIVGGYFIWVTLPPGLKSALVVQRAKEEENVVVAQVRCTAFPSKPAMLMVMSRVRFSRCLVTQSTQVLALTTTSGKKRFCFKDRCSIAAHRNMYTMTAAVHRA